jgi:hypothetical protein
MLSETAETHIGRLMIQRPLAVRSTVPSSARRRRHARFRPWCAKGIHRNRAAHRPGDPVRKTCETDRARDRIGKLLAMAQPGRQPDSDVTVAQLLDQYVSTAR